MALNPDILPVQTEANAPVDQDLMDGIRLNLERIDDEIVVAGSADFDFRVNGGLDFLDLLNNPDGGRELDTGFVSQPRTLSVVSCLLDEAGDGGTLEFNVKRLQFIGQPVSRIVDIYAANTQSIVRGSATLASQSISRAAVTQSTQLIEYAIGTESIDNIVLIPNFGIGYTRINLVGLGPLDASYEVDDYITLSGCTDPNNDGTFQIKELNQDGGHNIIIQNPLAANQTTIAGSVQLILVSYVFPSIVPSIFVAGELAEFVGHVDPSNDGSFEIHAINFNANNIVIKKATALVTQAVASGTGDVFRWSYNFLTAAPGAFVVGEVAEFTGHTDPLNNGSFEVKAVNDNAGNNVVIYNATGVLQPGVAGNVETNRWVYALDTDPAGKILVGDNIIMGSHTDPNNDGSFVAVDIKYLGTNNVVIYNALGVTQVGAAGNVSLTQKAIVFKEDVSSFLEIGVSSVTIKDTLNNTNDGTFELLDVNRPAVSPYNIIVDIPGGLAQPYDKGVLDSEFRSLFSAGSAVVPVSEDKTVKTFTVFSGEIIGAEIPADTILLVDVLQAPAGSANLAINMK